MNRSIDADACPGKRIIVRLAKQRGIPVTMLIDTSHELSDGYSTIITATLSAEKDTQYAFAICYGDKAIGSIGVFRRYDPFNFPEALNEALERFYKALFEKYRS